MSGAVLKCWHCGAALDDVPRPISRHAQCDNCFEVLHCCRMCRWYSPGRPQDCDHDRADPPLEKAAANFCEFFAPSRDAYDPRDAESRTQLSADAAARAAALFGDAGAPDDDAGSAGGDESQGEAEDPRSRLDNLFDD